jgi:hypothetical protein
VRLDVNGHPLHTRALSVTLTRRADGRVAVRGTILDLRKRGLVPVAGDLQGTGIIHHMLLDAVVDPVAGVLVSIHAEQPAVAFEASATTAGETCRDPIARIEALDGAPLDATFGRRIGEAVGGPRGCSHIATLAHFLGATVVWALERDRDAHGAAPTRAAGERIFRRELVVDGHEPAAGRLALAVQLADLLLEPAARPVRPIERLAGQLEFRALAETDLATFALTRVTGAERRRTRADLERAPWRERDDVLAPLAGLRLGAGITAELVRRLGERPEDRPLLDALLLLAPTAVQCAAALSEAWLVSAKASPSLVGMGGIIDSCYMWRRDGGLARAREADGGKAPAPPPR